HLLGRRAALGGPGRAEGQVRGTLARPRSDRPPRAHQRYGARDERNRRRRRMAVGQDQRQGTARHPSAGDLYRRRERDERAGTINERSVPRDHTEAMWHTAASPRSFSLRAPPPASRAPDGSITTAAGLAYRRRIFSRR